MEIPIDEVRRIAALARLALDPAFEEPLRRQLASVVDYVRHLESADVAGNVAAPGGEILLDELRADEPRDPVGSDDALRGAPDAGNGQFRVPRVLG